MQSLIIKYKINKTIETLNLAKYGLCIMERVKIPTPSMRYNTIEVPGRNGSLKVKQGFEDIEVNIPLNAMDHNLLENLRLLKTQKLMNIKEFSLSDDNSVFYKVKEVEIEDMENTVKDYGKFNLKLTCEPFAYLKETADFKKYNFENGIGYWRNFYFKNDGWETESSIKVKMPIESGINTHIKLNGISIVSLKVPKNSILVLDAEKELCYLTNLEGLILKNIPDAFFMKTKMGNNKIEVWTEKEAEIQIKRNIKYL